MVVSEFLTLSPASTSSITPLHAFVNGGVSTSLAPHFPSRYAHRIHSSLYLRALAWANTRPRCYPRVFRLLATLQRCAWRRHCSGEHEWSESVGKEKEAGRGRGLRADMSSLRSHAYFDCTFKLIAIAFIETDFIRSY